MKKIVVVGNGMVGYKFCASLVNQSNESQPDGGRMTLTVFGEEPRPAYDRVHLSAFFSGSSADEPEKKALRCTRS